MAPRIPAAGLPPASTARSASRPRTASGTRWLEAYRKVEGVWSGYVRYSVRVGETYIGWFEEGRIRGEQLG